MRSNVYICADGDKKDGLNHLNRCLELANVLKDDFDISFVCRYAQKNITKDINRELFAFINVDDEEYFLSMLKPSDIVVIDVYVLNEEQQKNLREKGCKVISMTDIPEMGEYVNVDGPIMKKIKRLFIKLHCSLRMADAEDSELLFKWANDPSVRETAFKSAYIEREDHENWFSKRIKNSLTKILILHRNSTPIGQIRFDKESSESDGEYWKISYSIDKLYRGMGMGTIIIELGLKEIQGLVKAFVKPDNIPSCKVFENLGFRLSNRIDDTVNEYQINI